VCGLNGGERWVKQGDKTRPIKEGPTTPKDENLKEMSHHGDRGVNRPVREQEKKQPKKWPSVRKKTQQGIREKVTGEETWMISNNGGKPQKRNTRQRHKLPRTINTLQGLKGSQPSKEKKLTDPHLGSPGGSVK